MDGTAPCALEGLKVLDFSRFLSGPVGTMFLGDMGADVLKVEQPGTGDDSRSLPPALEAGQSSTFLFANRNKRSVALDLREPTARAAARQLALQADVLVENFLPGVMARHGLAYDNLVADNPRLVYCSVTAFGSHGSFASRPGYDQIAQAESGFFSLTGEPDGPPYKSGAPVMDLSCGMMTSNAVLAALLARERSGRGQRVEVCLYDTAVFMGGHYVMNYLLTGVDPVRHGNGSSMTEPTGLFEAADGPFYLSCATDRNFMRLVREVLQCPELAEDSRFACAALRRQNRAALHAELAAVFRCGGRSGWLEKALAAGVPMGVVRTVGEAIRSPEMAQRDLVSQVPASDGKGNVPNLAPPFRLYGTPLQSPVGAPRLGQHTAEVLAGLPHWPRRPGTAGGQHREMIS